MAAFEYQDGGKRIPVVCHACGSTNMFQHAPQLLTCNKCGHTFNPPKPVTLLIERVVPTHEMP